jgi:glutathione synthase/RimK-type ligase-like ATP-grasp enzyme
MILLCGIPSESPLRLVIEAAERRGTPFVVVNQREAHQMELLYTVGEAGPTGVLQIQGCAHPLEAFTGIYSRFMDYRDLPEHTQRSRRQLEPDALEKSIQIQDALTAWIEVAPCRVMNRSAPMGSNGSKPFQAQLIRQVGFSVPTTLITNNPEEARQFARKHRGAIFKSISGIRSIVRPLSDVKMLDLERVRYLPTQFQAFVPGVNIRVHLAGDAIFATEIESDAVDYRYASRENAETRMKAIRLPDAIEERCRALSRFLELPLCGIDLKRTPDGDYYCFEVNPSPGYSYYQEHTGQDIADAIVGYLSGAQN